MPVKFDIEAVRRSAARLGLTAKAVATLETRLKGTLRRRMVVEAKRDMAAETLVPKDRLAADLGGRTTESGVEIVGRRRGIGLINYAGEWGGRTSPGATAQVIRGERETIKGAFVAPLGNARQIVKRVGPKVIATKGRYKGQKRQRIEVEYGPSVGALLSNKKRGDRLEAFAAKVAIAEVDRLLDIK